MKLIKHHFILKFSGFLLAVAIPTVLEAGSITYDTKAAVTKIAFSPFSKGVMELEVTGGAFGGLGTNGTESRPDVGYALGSARLGWMLNDPTGSGVLRGNFEFLVGAYGGWIFKGPGDYLVGGDLNLRYNFVQPSATIVPFIQIGAGGAYSDAASDDEVQRLIGSDWSWKLQGGIGIRWMLNEHMAFTAIVEYQHFSNADSSFRNRGLNALGGLVGVSWFY